MHKLKALPLYDAMDIWVLCHLVVTINLFKNQDTIYINNAIIVLCVYMCVCVQSFSLRAINNLDVKILHVRPSQWKSFPSSNLVHKVSISTTANARSPFFDTAIFWILRLLCTRLCEAERSNQLFFHRSKSNRPISRVQPMGSCKFEVLGYGQTMSGWKRLINLSIQPLEHLLQMKQRLPKWHSLCWHFGCGVIPQR